MRSGRHLFTALAVAAASLLGARSLADAPNVAPRMDPPSPPRRRDEEPGARYARRAAKKRRERERRLKASGISGAGLWRKCRAGGRVRGW